MSASANVARSLVDRPESPRLRPSDFDVTRRARRFFAEALGDGALAGRAIFVAAPAPIAPLDALLAAAPGRAALFEPPAGDGLAIAGLGEAARLDVGPGGLARLREDAQELLSGLLVQVHKEAIGATPRLLGGAAFESRGPHEAASRPTGDGAWREFGAGAFTLPRWTYTVERNDGRAALAFAGTAPEDPAQLSAVLDEYDRITAALTGPPRRRSAARVTLRRTSEQHLRLEVLPEPAWVALVEAARAEIAAGRLDKVVIARRSVVETEGPIDAAAVLAALSTGGPGGTRFAFRAGSATFLGSTPERLVVKQGARVRTEALAGTAPPNGSAAALLESRKDLDEHDFVVREITARLGPRCRALAVPDRPRVRALRDVLHLLTPIEGELLGPAHVLDLVRDLHPTPAVGGLPCAEALRFIAAREPAPRGWYAGPIGWFDAAGDGEFAVALRAGLIEGSRALVYAGAGIVAASDAAAEYVETALKQRALLAALSEATEGAVP